ncbi:hypothetical protein [Pyxidicoccus xibeiensis]|uniref:hypothetical protein n=1 Tax=Pyxidicoccus xibeiensis TaxID=2906759 RepID=UPI0020A7092B|nr:hypothetical protein [Pyxidicoccus xibeiensis]MCP3142414.1 hypothetical protein [Pyxidicoccus xibeiensis]
MLRSFKSLWLVPALLLGACGPTDAPSGDAPTGTDTQGAHPIGSNLTSLTLNEYPVSSSLQAELAAANAACGSEYDCYGELRGYSFSWSQTTPASLNAVADAVMQVERSYAMDGIRLSNMSYAQFVQSRLISRFSSLNPDLLNEYSNGTESVQVTGWTYRREMWPDACMVWEMYVIYFPQSRRVLVFEQDHGHEC